MYLDRNKFNETPSFAIDSRKDSSENMGTCLDQSDEKMKHLIHSCAGNMALRALTEEERAKMQQYKKEQQGWHLSNCVEYEILTAIYLNSK